MHSPLEIAKNYISVCVNKTRIPVLKMYLLGIMAGFFIAFAGVNLTVASGTIPVYGRLIGAAAFPMGMAVVLLAGSELFTGNNLIILAVLTREVRLRDMLKNWIIVYLGNLTGTTLIAAATVYSGVLDGFYQTAVNIAASKATMPFTDALIRGILCNILVCVAVWMSFASKRAEGKILTVFFPIMAFVFCGFEHSIANMYYLPAGLLSALRHGASADGLNWVSCYLGNLLPVTLGNIIGGCLFVGCIYWYIYLHTNRLTQKQEEEELDHAEEY